MDGRGKTKSVAFCGPPPDESFSELERIVEEKSSTSRSATERPVRQGIMPAKAKRAVGSTSSSSQNIKVAVRVRGGLPPEQGRALRVTGDSVDVLGAGPSGGPLSFTFDYCYGPEATQVEVYEDIGGQILDHAFEGYNGTIFAYGQTGSGKSHSIMGSPGQLGIVPRLAVELFERVAAVAASAAQASFEVTATYLELYNEVIHDLLTPGNTNLKIRQHVSSGIYVENLTEVQVASHEEIERLIAEGNKARMVAATRMNERSSRSHAIFSILLKQVIHETDGTIRTLTSKVNLVDLAGSERADLTADAKQLQEGAAINKSLSALGNVINALTEAGGSGKGGKASSRGGKAATARKAGGGGDSGAGYIPYRSSKLTRLLEESLGGNTVTFMLAAISAEERNLRETIATLKYAARAKSIKNSKSKNEAKEEKRKIRELTAEIERLNSQIANGAASAAAMPTGGEGGRPTDTDLLREAADAAEREAKLATHLAEVRIELERAKEEATTAHTAALADQAAAAELRAEIDAGKAYQYELDARLQKSAAELTALRGAHRSSELEANHLRQQLNQERLQKAEHAHKQATLAEDIGVLRRQLAAAQKGEAAAREAEAEAEAQKRIAEGKLAAAEAQLATHASIHTEGERDKRASTELLGAASRDKRAQADLMERNLAAFEAVLAEKDAQLQACHERIASLRHQEEAKGQQISELQAQLASRAASVGELAERKGELLGQVESAQADAQRWAEEASRARRTADTLEADVAGARREVELLRRKVEVKEMHVTKLMSENATLAEKLRVTNEHSDTPNAMLREMLRMSSVELKLNQQLHEQKQVKFEKRIEELERELERRGVQVSQPVAKPMSFASFFKGLGLGGGGAKDGGEGAKAGGGGGGGGGVRTDGSDDGSGDEARGGSRGGRGGGRVASFGKAARARASFGRDGSLSEPRKASASGYSSGGDEPSTSAASSSQHQQLQPYRTPPMPNKRMSFAKGGGNTPSSAVAEVAAEAVEAVADTMGRTADAAGRAVGSIVKSTNSLFGGITGGLFGSADRLSSDGAAPHHRHQHQRNRDHSYDGDERFPRRRQHHQHDGRPERALSAEPQAQRRHTHEPDRRRQSWSRGGGGAGGPDWSASRHRSAGASPRSPPSRRRSFGRRHEELSYDDDEEEDEEEEGSSSCTESDEDDDGSSEYSEEGSEEDMPSGSAPPSPDQRKRSTYSSEAWGRSAAAAYGASTSMSAAAGGSGSGSGSPGEWMPPPPHPVQLPGEESGDETEKEAGGGERAAAAAAVASRPPSAPAFFAQSRSERRPQARSLAASLASPPERDVGLTPGRPSQAASPSDGGDGEWGGYAQLGGTHGTAKRPPRAPPTSDKLVRTSKRPPRALANGIHRPSPGPSPSASPNVGRTSKKASWSRDRSRSPAGGSPPSPPSRSPGRSPGRRSPSKRSPSRGKAARRVPSWPAGEERSRRRSKDGAGGDERFLGMPQVPIAVPRSVSFALTSSPQLRGR